MRKKMLMVVGLFICHKVVGALRCIISGKGEAELHSRHRGKRQQSLGLGSKGVVETILKQSWWGPWGAAVHWNRGHEAVLVVLDLSLQFHPSVLKPGLNLSNKKKGGMQETSQGLCPRIMCKLWPTVSQVLFPFCFRWHWHGCTDAFALLSKGPAGCTGKNGCVQGFYNNQLRFFKTRYEICMVYTQLPYIQGSLPH